MWDCKVVKVVVPEPFRYAMAFAPGGDYDTLNGVQSIVYAGLEVFIAKLQRSRLAPEEKERLLEALDRLPPEELYCARAGYEAALVLEKEGQTFNPHKTVVVYGLSGGDAERAAREIEDYVYTIKDALRALPEGPGKREFERRCYRLDGGSPAECLGEARRILSRRGGREEGEPLAAPA